MGELRRDLARPGGQWFCGGAFDGKYVYLVPHGGMAARYDTSTDFRTRSSWSTFAVPQLAPLAMGFYGAGFDGRYTYFVPNNVAQVGEQCSFDAVLAR